MLSASDEAKDAVMLRCSDLASAVRRLSAAHPGVLERASHAMTTAGLAVLGAHDAAVAQASRDSSSDELVRAVQSAVVDAADAAWKSHADSLAEQMRSTSAELREVQDTQTAAMRGEMMALRADLADGPRCAVQQSVGPALSAALWHDTLGMGKLRDDLTSLRTQVLSLATRSDTNSILREQEKATAAAMEAMRARTASEASSSVKGRDTEEAMLAALRARLLQRDGWTLEHVGTEAHACDIVVERSGHPRVRLEVKQKQRIDKQDLSKFLRDLAENREPGIFVSCECAVPAYHPGITFLKPAASRYAAIVSPGGDFPKLDAGAGGADLVVTALFALHALHAEMASSLAAQDAAAGVDSNSDLDAGSDGADRIHLDATASARLRDAVRRNEEDLKGVQTDIQSSIHSCNRALARVRRMAQERVLTLLEGGVDTVVPASQGRRCGACKHCGKEYVVMACLRKHEETCSSTAPACVETK